MTQSHFLFIVALCCCLLCPCLACDKDSKFPVDNQLSDLDEPIPNIFLCRMCGLSQDDEGFFIDTASPFSLSVRNETILFERNKKTVSTTVSVQKLRNPAGVIFDVVTLRKSSCKGVGKVESSLSLLYLSPSKFTRDEHFRWTNNFFFNAVGF